MPKNHFIMIKATLEEKENIKRLAAAEGCATVTDYCRKRLFKELSHEEKLNQIIEMLKKRKIKE